MNDILIKILVSIGILVLTNVFVYLSNLSKEKIAKKADRRTKIPVRRSESLF